MKAKEPEDRGVRPQIRPICEICHTEQWDAEDHALVCDSCLSTLQSKTNAVIQLRGEVERLQDEIERLIWENQCLKKHKT